MVATDKYYVTPTDIRDILNASSTTYPDTYLNKVIVRAMNTVDDISDNTWNGRVKIAEEVHNLDEIGFVGGWIFSNGFKFKTAHPDILEVMELKYPYKSSGATTLTITDETNDRITSYWYDDIDGVVYLRRFVFWHGSREVYIKYKYGNTQLPNEISELTLWLCLREINMMDRFQNGLADGGETTTDKQNSFYNERIEFFTNKCRALKEVVLVRSLGEYYEEA